MSQPAESMGNEEVRAAWAALAAEVRTAVLLTMRDGHPFGSHVPYIFGDDWTRAYLHLSRLALHTQHLLTDSRLSLFVAEPDKPEKNPLALRRMNLQGKATILPADSPRYSKVKAGYLARFPQSAVMFDFGDFNVWELQLCHAHLVLGFGQAYLSSASAPLFWIHQQPDRRQKT